MSTFEILLILKLDSIIDFFSWVCFFAILISIISLIPIIVITLNDNVAPDFNGDGDLIFKRWSVRAFKIAFPLGLVCALLSTLTPTTKQIITAVTAGSIINNQKILSISPKILDVIDLELDKKITELKKQD